jgi:hypothetical protein
MYGKFDSKLESKMLSHRVEKQNSPKKQPGYIKKIENTMVINYQQIQNLSLKLE